MSDQADALEVVLGGLAAEGWKARKDAVLGVSTALADADPERQAQVIERLISMVVSPPSPSARAAATEVLGQLGGRAAPTLRATLARTAEGGGKRALVEVLGVVGDATDGEAAPPDVFGAPGG